MKTQENYALQFPIKLENGAELKEITIVRPRGKHLRLLPDEAFTGEPISPVLYLPMLASMINVDVIVLDEMDVVDINEAVAILMRFLSASRQTGEN